MDRQIVVGRDFAKYPGPRYARTGSSSGEEFRNRLLIPLLREAIKNGTRLTVYLDDVAGYGSSFLEESFGGLIRAGLSKDEILGHLVIDAHTVRLKHHALRALEYISDAAKRDQLLAH
jgi:hypothetical protein